ncbi:MAG: hypothetical protein GY854_14930 [Deltaproteobacteria bacterium]|nr:hypothetical protein [Deltaproteobacteria bacterium]
MKTLVEREIESLERARQEFCRHDHQNAAEGGSPRETGDEQIVIDLFTERISSSRKTYGPLDLKTDKRDMLVETTEEVLDGMIYLAAQLIKLRRRKGKL